MTGRIATNNTVTLEGYVHCCRLMLKGMLEEKASLISYLANGSNSPPSWDDCYGVILVIMMPSIHFLSFLCIVFQAGKANCLLLFLYS